MIKDDQLCCPVSLVREWSTDDQCCADFSKWLDEFSSNKSYKITDPEAEAEEEKKRKASEQQTEPGSGPTPKKLKEITANLVDPNLLGPVSTISAALLYEVKMTGKDAPSLHLRANHEAWLVSQAAKWTMVDPFVAGFGNGGFKMVKPGQDPPSGSVEFKLESRESLVVLNNVIMPLEKVMQDMRSKRPDAKISYYNILAKENLNHFDLECTHRVLFVPKTEDNKELKQNNAACKIGPWLQKGQSPCLKLLWAVQWRQKGLMPVKPVVHVVGKVDIPEGHCLRCHPA